MVGPINWSIDYTVGGLSGSISFSAGNIFTNVVDGISGTFNGQTITGMIAPGGYNGNDNHTAGRGEPGHFEGVSLQGMSFSVPDGFGGTLQVHLAANSSLTGLIQTDDFDGRTAIRHRHKFYRILFR
jgi:hypothetical protein